jgi:putative MATE family efflux protein
MTNKREINLLQGSLYKNIIKLGYPMALGSLAQTLYNMADAFWLGKLGKEALSAPIISFFILFFMISIGIGFSISGTSLVSQYIGAKQQENANRAAGNLLSLLVILSIVFSVIGLVFDEELLRLLGTPADTFKETLDYYQIMIVGLPLAFPIFVYQAAMNGYGDTMSPLKISLFTAAINLVIDPLLIFGWLGFPAMGVKGAAIATVLTRGIASFLGVYLFFSGKKGIKLKLALLKPNKQISKLMFKIGIPSAVGFSGSSLGFIVLIKIVNMFGTSVVSAYGISTRVIHLFMLPAMGISSAVTAIVGQNLGAGNIARAKEVVKKGILLMLSIITLPTILCAIFGEEVTRVFIPGDPQVHQIGSVMFHIAALSIIFFGVATVLEGVFQGAGRTVPVMVSSLTRIWIFRIPVVYIISIVLLKGPENIGGHVGIWWGMVISNLASLTIISLWYARGTWAKARIDKIVPAEK